jgi:hypothetical protein
MPAIKGLLQVHSDIFRCHIVLEAKDLLHVALRNSLKISPCWIGSVDEMSSGGIMDK